MKKAFNEVLEFNYTNSIFVGHGGIFVNTIKDICCELDISELKNANCSITKLSVEKDKDLKIRVLSWSSTIHLSGEAADLVPGVPTLDRKFIDQE